MRQNTVDASSASGVNVDVDVDVNTRDKETLKLLRRYWFSFCLPGFPDSTASDALYEQFDNMRRLLLTALHAPPPTPVQKKKKGDQKKPT